MKADTAITRLANQIHVGKLQGLMHEDVPPQSMARKFLLANYIRMDESDDWLTPNCLESIPSDAKSFMFINEDRGEVEIFTPEQGGSCVVTIARERWTEFLGYKPIDEE